MGLLRRFTPRNDGGNGRHCEGGSPWQSRGIASSLLSVAPRNDEVEWDCFAEFTLLRMVRGGNDSGDTGMTEKGSE